MSLDTTGFTGFIELVGKIMYRDNMLAQIANSVGDYKEFSVLMQACYRISLIDLSLDNESNMRLLDEELKKMKD